MSALVQEIITIGICAVAGFAVAKRIWSQFAAIFRAANSKLADSEAASCSGCDSCGLRKAVPTGASQLISISSVSPKRIHSGNADA